MLVLLLPGEEIFDERTQTFGTVGDVVLQLEHSLLSISKWESEYQKPFLGGGEKSTEEVFGYIQHMCRTPVSDWSVLKRIDDEAMGKINAYIESKESATTFGEMPPVRGPKETITSELIYYWMVAFNIPFECERWHINRLFSLIRICNLKQQKPKKMSRHQIAQRNRELNEQRRAKFNTSG